MAGERNGMVKLTVAQVLDIFRSEGLEDQVAKRFGISRALVGLIRRRQRWASVTSERP